MSPSVHHFGDFELDPGRRELRRRGEAVPMGPQVFDLLLHLVVNRDRVVSKDDMIAAVWKGRIVSDATLASHVNAIRRALGDSGEAQRFVKTIARKGVRFVAELRAAEEMPVTLSLPERPSVAVLPFANLGGDPEQAYFADGMAEDIITALSRFRSLFVIARNSSFSYRGRAVDLRQVGRELGVRYVLEGSVRRAGGKLRFTAQLIDTATGGHVWADRHDGADEDVFALQDRITEAVAGALNPAIHQAEIARVRRKHPGHLGAYEHYLRGLALTHSFVRADIEAMLAASLEAIALDPNLAPAYALAVRAHIQRLNQGSMIYGLRERTEALALIERGLAADRTDAWMLATAGQGFAWLGGDVAKGLAYLDEAIAINPNHCDVFLQSGVVRARAGDPAQAIDHLQRAQRLSPRDLRAYASLAGLALAHLRNGDAEAALVWARRATQHNRNYVPAWYGLAAAAAQTGELEEARTAARELLALNPAFTVSGMARRYPIGDAAKFEPILEGLRLAGVPEG